MVRFANGLEGSFIGPNVGATACRYQRANCFLLELPEIGLVQASEEAGTKEEVLDAEQLLGPTEEEVTLADQDETRSLPLGYYFIVAFPARYPRRTIQHDGFTYRLSWYYLRPSDGGTPAGGQNSLNVA